MITKNPNADRLKGSRYNVQKLERNGLVDILVRESDWLKSRIEEMEIIIIRDAFCPERPLRSLVERLEAKLHGLLGPKRLPAAEDYLIVGDPKVSALADYVRNGRVWENDHVLGCAPGGISIMTVTSELRITTCTEFACTAAAWDSLNQTEQRQLMPFRVIHGFWHDQLFHESAPHHERLIQWMARKTSELPLVQPLTGGRFGLLVDDTAVQVSGMEFSDSEIFLHDLRQWVTQSAFVYCHHWQPGDLVIWSSSSVMYRDLPRLNNPVWKVSQWQR